MLDIPRNNFYRTEELGSVSEERDSEKAVPGRARDKDRPVGNRIVAQGRKFVDNPKSGIFLGRHPGRANKGTW